MEFVSPRSTDELVALAAKARGMVRYLAGGTDVLVQLRSGRVEPDVVFDIKKIPEMGTIAEDDEGWRIGAAVSASDINRHEGVRQAWPGIAEAIGLIGSTQIQERATMIGNLCNGSPAADSVPPMITANATVRIAHQGGIRTLPVADMPVAPGQTALEHGELVLSVTLPRQDVGAADAYLRFIPRTEMDIAVASCAVWMQVEAGRVRDMRVALGAVAPTPLLIEDASRCTVGTRLEAPQLEALRDMCSKSCTPIGDKRGTASFRRRVVGVLAMRAAREAYERAGRRR